VDPVTGVVSLEAVMGCAPEQEVWNATKNRREKISHVQMLYFWMSNNYFLREINYKDDNHVWWRSRNRDEGVSIQQATASGHYDLYIGRGRVGNQVSIKKPTLPHRQPIDCTFTTAQQCLISAAIAES